LWLLYYSHHFCPQCLTLSTTLCPGCCVAGIGTQQVIAEILLDIRTKNNTF
jgi:hypothetical protein